MADFATIIQIWLAALFTIWIYSIAFRDNVFFKFAEHTFVGAAAGHSLVMGVDNILRIGWGNFIGGNYIYIIVFVLGVLLFTRYHSNYYWVSRFPLAVLVGIGVGLMMRTTVTSEFIAQIQSTAGMKLLGVDTWTAFSNLVFIIITLSVVYYFIFTFPKVHGGKLGIISTIAKYGMMAAFGYSFANTVLSRFNMIFGRFDFIMNTWLPLPYAMIALPVALILVIYVMIPAERRPWPKTQK